MALPIEFLYNERNGGQVFPLGRIEVGPEGVTISFPQSGTVLFDRQAWAQVVEKVNGQLEELQREDNGHA